MTTQIKGNDTSTFGGNIDVPQIVTDAPAFGAYQDTSQTLSTSTFTKLTFTIEEFDTNSDFASSKFTPTVEGYYLITGAFGINSMNGTQILSIYKNGNEFKRGTLRSDSATASGRHTTISTIVYANGSTDYFELYAYQGSGSNATTRNSQRWTYVNGVLVRAV
jgi:hypothetical protein